MTHLASHRPANSTRVDVAEVETYRAVLPALMTTGGMLVAISSPYRRTGLLYSKWEKHHGKDDPAVLVVQASSRTLNPTLDETLIDAAREEDPEAARAEWDGEFRTDIESFINLRAVSACVEEGVFERRPMLDITYTGFVDVAGGSGGDSMTLGIAHTLNQTRERDGRWRRRTGGTGRSSQDRSGEAGGREDRTDDREVHEEAQTNEHRPGMTKKETGDGDDGLVAPGEAHKIEVEKRADEKIGRTIARYTLDPRTRNASLAMGFGGQLFSDCLQPDIMQSSAVLGEEIERAMKGDLGLASRIYTAQAISLDTVFTEMARRSSANMAEYPQAAERYMRLALKAQSACRTTLEALARLHQPREQTVKHVHVNEGGQAVVAEHVHHHAGGAGNGKTSEQSDAARQACQRSALPCPDPFGNGVPISSGEREAAMQDARRHESWRA